MQIYYKFTSDAEPTDEQLHLLMQEVAIEAKNRARKSDEKFSEELQLLVQAAQKQRIAANPGTK
ncbi:MAG: hypothetical protein NTV01_02270 [Bacteroidia bacterium]|nr:hypothetical protein [Bacteroidia bacterium]